MITGCLMVLVRFHRGNHLHFMGLHMSLPLQYISDGDFMGGIHQ